MKRVTVRIVSNKNVGLRGSQGLSGIMGSIGPQGLFPIGDIGDQGNPGPTCSCRIDEDVEDVTATGASYLDYLKYNSSESRWKVSSSNSINQVEYTNIPSYDAATAAFSSLGHARLWRLSDEPEKVRLTWNNVIQSGLIEDFNPDFGITLTSNKVSEWSSSVNGGEVLVASGSEDIELYENNINGHNAVRVNDTSKLIGSNTDRLDPLMTGSGFTVFIILKDASDSAIFKNLINSSPFSGFGLNASGDFHLRPQGANNFFGSGFDIQGSNYKIITGRLEDGTGPSQLFEYYVNTPVASGSGTSDIYEDTDSGALTIGAERTGGNEWGQSTIARFCIYNRPLTDSEVERNFLFLQRFYDI